MKQLILMSRSYDKSGPKVIVMNPKPPEVVTVVTAYRDDQIYRYTLETELLEVVPFPLESVKALKVTVDPRYLYLTAPSAKAAKNRAKNLVTKFKIDAGTEIAG